MDLHIYCVPGSSEDQIVKPSTKDSIIYYVGGRASSRSPREFYRGNSKSAPKIATIRKEGYWKPDLKIEFERGEDIVIREIGVFSPKYRFWFKKKEYGWNQDLELIDVATKSIIAIFERRIFAWTKKGVLRISEKGLKMVDVIVVTGLSIQIRREEQTS
jgi:hypothetical protein